MLLGFIASVTNPILIYGGMFSKAVTGYWARMGGEKEAWHKSFLSTSSSDDLRESIRATVKRLVDVSSKTLLIEFPEFGIDSQEILLKSELFSDLGLTKLQFKRSNLLDYHKEGELLMNKLVNDFGAVKIEALDFICEADKCTPIQNSKQMYTDKIHPSRLYTDKVSSFILDSLKSK